MEAVPIKPAATLVLLRQGKEGPEVLLMRRHGKSAFMGGVHVFPGGKVDAHDADAAYEDFLSDFDWGGAARRLRMDSAQARAHYIAVLRETFEEAGALLAMPKDSGKGASSLVRFDAPEIAARFSEHRERLNSREHPQTLLDVVREEGLVLRPDLLVYFDHWITPEIERPKRFDTHFFAALTPEGQEIVHHEQELTEWAWLRPAEAMQRYERGEIQLAPPTWVSLWRLSKFASVAEALSGLSKRTVTTMLPRPAAAQGMMKLVLPGHPDYGALPHPDDAVPEEGNPRAFAMKDGRWMLVE